MKERQKHRGGICRFELLRFVFRICFGFRASDFGFGCSGSALLFVVALAGCGDSGPKKYRVTGEVTWEGAPLAEGDIILEPVDGGIPDHGKITTGKFEMQATEGEKTVSIMATKEAAEVDPSMGMAPRVNYIPLRYNAQTTLEANIEPNDDNHLSFALTEKEE